MEGQPWGCEGSLSGVWRRRSLNVSARAPRVSGASVLHPLDGRGSRRGDRCTPDACTRAGAAAGSASQAPRGRAGSQPLLGQGQERPCAAVPEASEVSPGPHLPGASILGGEKRWHRSAPSPFICSYIHRALYLQLGYTTTGGSRGSYKTLLTIGCCEILCIRRGNITRACVCNTNVCI